MIGAMLATASCMRASMHRRYLRNGKRLGYRVELGARR